MWYVAITLGLFGSLHCIGMCGPLAIAASASPSHNRIEKISSVFKYNIGRTITYTILGVLFGLLGGLVLLAHIQKAFSIGAGLLLILAFLFSINIESHINSSWFGTRLHFKVKLLLEKTITSVGRNNPFYIGLVNGLLPCGLVYLALAGALASGSLVNGMFFMMMFGIGTTPIMVTLALGYQSISFKWRSRLKKTIPIVSLCFGIYLSYRGIVVNIPDKLDFWSAINNPIMCH